MDELIFNKGDKVLVIKEPAHFSTGPRTYTQRTVKKVHKTSRFVLDGDDTQQQWTQKGRMTGDGYGIGRFRVQKYSPEIIAEIKEETRRYENSRNLRALGVKLSRIESVNAASEIWDLLETLPEFKTKVGELS